ncbi:hypothetical protein AB0937_23380 [Streptomyces sp. NPDC047880]|uniref:hypothetical protein n=1 Tax=Streptomyces sp. NPDC047880 TaxID=3155626 RepID=UPI003453CA12
MTNSTAKPRGATRPAPPQPRREPPPHQDSTTTARREPAPHQDSTARGSTAPHRREPSAPRAPAPGATGPFTPRVRGRHRKPRSRKVLLATGGLALAAGALSFLRLSSGPGAGAGPLEAGSRPDPAATATDGATRTAVTFPAVPDASPSSPTALGGLTPSPVTQGARPSPSTTAGVPVTATTAAPAPTTIPDAPNAQAPAPSPTASHLGDAPSTASPPAAPPSRTAPAPAPAPPEKEKPPHDPGLCVPVVGLCVDSPVGRR